MIVPAVLLIAGLSILLYTLSQGQAGNPAVSFDSGSCRNDSLTDGTDWKSLARNHFNMAQAPARHFSLPPELLLAILIHETRLRDIAGAAGELGAAQIYPPTLKVLLEKYPSILAGKNPRNLTDAFWFAAAHLNMTANALKIFPDSSLNVLAYNRGAAGVRGRNPQSECYSKNVMNLYASIAANLKR